MAAAPAPGNWKAGGAPAPPCCNADMSAAIGSSGGGAAVVEDAAMEGATAVEDDDVDEALGLGRMPITARLGSILAQSRNVQPGTVSGVGTGA